MGAPRRLTPVDDVHPDDVLPAAQAEARHPTEYQHNHPESRKPLLRAVDRETGEVICADCRRNEDLVQRLQQEAIEADKELRRYRSKVTTLETQIAKAREDHPQKAEIKAIFEKWKECTGHPKSKLTGDRIDAIAKWLKHYSAEEMYWAFAYVGAFPYMKPDGYGERTAEPSRGQSKGDKKDDIEYLFEKAGRFEKFANEGYRLLRRNGTIQPTTLFDTK